MPVVILIAAVAAISASRSRGHALGIMAFCVINHGIFVLYVGPSAIKLPMIVCGAASLVLLLRGQWGAPRGAYAPACAAFFGWLVVSSAVANVAALPLAMLMIYGKGVVFGLLIAGFARSIGDLKIVAAYICFGVFFASLFNIWQSANGSYVIQNEWAMERSRAAGARGDPNDTAMILIAAIPLFWSLVSAERMAPLLRFTGLVGAATALAGVILTASRAGFIVVVVLLAILIARKPSKEGVVLGAVGVLAFFLFASGAYWDRMETLASGEGQYQGQSLAGRYHLAVTGLNMFAENPVFGVGVGNFGHAFIEFMSGGLVSSSSHIPPVAHNMYIQMLAECGAPGLGLFLLIFYIAFTGFRALDRALRAGPGGPRIGYAFALSLLSFALMGSTLSQAHSSVLWLFLGLGGACHAFAKDLRADQASSAGNALRTARS